METDRLKHGIYREKRSQLNQQRLPQDLKTTQGREEAKKTTQQSSCLKGTSLLPVSLMVLSEYHFTLLLPSVFLPHCQHRPRQGGFGRHHVWQVLLQGPPAPAAGSCPTASGIPGPGVPAGLGRQGASPEERGSGGKRALHFHCTRNKRFPSIYSCLYNMKSWDK